MKQYNIKPNTQKGILYQYLLGGKTITSLDAAKLIRDLGILDLQSVIRDLKKAGVPIKTTTLEVPTRRVNSDGSVKMAYVAQYRLGAVAGNLF